MKHRTMVLAGSLVLTLALAGTTEAADPYRKPRPVFADGPFDLVEAPRPITPWRSVLDLSRAVVAGVVREVRDLGRIQHLQETTEPGSAERVNRRRHWREISDDSGLSR